MKSKQPSKGKPVRALPESGISLASLAPGHEGDFKARLTRVSGKVFTAIEHLNALNELTPLLKETGRHDIETSQYLAEQASLAFGYFLGEIYCQLMKVDEDLDGMRKEVLKAYEDFEGRRESQDKRLR